MRKKKLILILVLSLLTLSYEENKKITNFYHSNIKPKSEHYLVKWKAWQILSVVGMFGTISNSFLLFIFYSERKLLVTSVNVMICMDTLYRLVYATITIHWRTHNMVQDKTMFHHWLGREQVECLLRAGVETFLIL